MIDRRMLLKTLAALPLASSSTGLWAVPASKTRLLVVFLRGGYDAANLLVPISSQFYYDVRPTIAVPRPNNDLNSALALNTDWGLHPALRDSIYPLFMNGQAAFIPFAGTTDISRSHFETQDSIELGQSLEHGRNYRSGFLNRLAVELNGSTGISFTDQLPLIMQGSLSLPNTTLRTVGRSSIDARQSKLISSMYTKSNLASQVAEGFVVRDDVAREMIEEMDAANRNAITAKGFELEARRIAKLMKDKYNIGFIDVGGWDTHVGEGGGTGYLASRFDELGRGLAAFAQEMGTEWHDTVTVVVSEFGRTIRENGNRGTDHGHGTVYWVLGGGISGGKILGEQILVNQPNLFQNRDYSVLNEYRAVLGGLFSRMYGLGGTQIDRIFAGAKSRDLGII